MVAIFLFVSFFVVQIAKNAVSFTYLLLSISRLLLYLFGKDAMCFKYDLLKNSCENFL